ncbi:MAG TPA: hypothetical protein VJH94_03040 [Candidatus Paceibacterota bacterium]
MKIQVLDEPEKSVYYVELIATLEEDVREIRELITKRSPISPFLSFPREDTPKSVRIAIGFG